MLSKDFVALVLLSCCIAIPIAWYFLHEWLQQYAICVPHGAVVVDFAAAGAGALLITLLTVSFQSIKAAIANPVKSLRTD